MKQAALKSATILRTASGEPPLGHAGLSFRDDQGETFAPHDQAYQGAGKIGVLELENGLWLARPFKVNGMQCDTRNAAMRASIARMIRNARRFMRSGEGEGTHWTEGYAGRVIEWALSLKPAQVPESRDVLADLDQPISDVQAYDDKTEFRALAAIDGGVRISGSILFHLQQAGLIETVAGDPGVRQLTEAGEQRLGILDHQFRPEAYAFQEEITPPANVANGLAAQSPSEEITPEMAAEELTIAGYAASDAGAGLSDPVVKYLVEQHALRKQFPAKHIFSMTTEVAEGRIVSVATCTCKQVFRFGSNDVLRMNAAIEAHWRRFPHEKTVDGRGQPIGEPAKKSRKPKTASEAGGNSQPRNPAPVEMPSAGAGGIEPAQICAADSIDYDDPFIRTALDLAWREPPTETDTISETPLAGSVTTEQLSPKITLHCGSCLDALLLIEADSVDACVTDPPYHLTANKKGGSGESSLNINSPAGRSRISTGGGFMGKAWDGGDVAFQVETWRRIYRVLKPGAHLLAFSGTRTYHRMVCAIEDAGFEIRDQIGWLYGSGFPKSLNVSKAIDKAAGADPAKQWDGWGTALKPSQEPIILARKPLSEKTVAANVLRWGTGAINIDGCRVGDFVNSTPPGTDRYNAANFEQGYRPSAYGRDGEASAEKRYTANGSTNFAATPGPRGGSPAGRWPANILHDGSDDVVMAFPVVGDSHPPSNEGSVRKNQIYGPDNKPRTFNAGFSDSGSSARFFYTAKADADDRLGSKHPTVKPIDLMQWLCRLVTPKGGTILDPFAGTGTTGEAAFREGFNAVLIEREAEYQEDIRRRVKLMQAGPEERAREIVKQKLKDQPIDAGPLFGGSDSPPRR